jgi:hypothetical protein
MEFIDKDREELVSIIQVMLERLEHLSSIWTKDKTNEQVWFEAVQIMGQVAPLVEEYRQGVELESGQTYIN